MAAATGFLYAMGSPTKYVYVRSNWTCFVRATNPVTRLLRGMFSRTRAI